MLVRSVMLLCITVMIEQRLEQESKSTEKVQYIRNGKVETEMGT